MGAIKVKEFYKNQNAADQKQFCGQTHKNTIDTWNLISYYIYHVKILFCCCLCCVVEYWGSWLVLGLLCFVIIETVN